MTYFSGQLLFCLPGCTTSNLIGSRSSVSQSILPIGPSSCQYYYNRVMLQVLVLSCLVAVLPSTLLPTFLFLLIFYNIFLLCLFKLSLLPSLWHNQLASFDAFSTMPTILTHFPFIFFIAASNSQHMTLFYFTCRCSRFFTKWVFFKACSQHLPELWH